MLFIPTIRIVLQSDNRPMDNYRVTGFDGQETFFAHKEVAYKLFNSLNKIYKADKKEIEYQKFNADLWE